MNTETMRAVHVTGPTADDWREVDVSRDLGALQEAVGGGYIEALPIDSSKATVFINDEGAIKVLPVFTFWTDEHGQIIDSLHGPILILGPVDEEGETQPLTDEALAYVRRFVHPVRQRDNMIRVFTGPKPCTRCGGVGLEPEVKTLPVAESDLSQALRDLRDAATEAYMVGRVAAEPFVRAGNVLASWEERGK
jgi:hypothetical protein